MTTEELRAITVQDVLEGEEYEKRIKKVLKNLRLNARTHRELLLISRLKEYKLLHAENFIPVLEDVLNKQSVLPSIMCSYIFHVGMKVFKDIVRELKEQCEDMKNE